MIEKQLQDIITRRYHKKAEECGSEELYYSLLELTKEITKERGYNEGERKLYYISAEFLIGKLLSNNLINLGLFEEVREILERFGKSIEEVEAAEPEPSLGNGGLGRLAACFLDSIATLSLPGDGIGLNYHYGLFRQIFEKHKQKELINPWIEPESWLNRTDIYFEIPFKNFTLKSRLYDIDVTGYGSKNNKLHLFDVETVDEGLVEEGIRFDKSKVEKNLTLFLYPDDSDKEGNLLRIYQQYFMVSSGAQLILKECREKGYDLHKLDQHVVIQINDTHPTLVIPELIRLLMLEGIRMDEAIGIVSRTCAYTNHTILSEALEKWPFDYLNEVVPHLMPIICELDTRVKEEYADEKVQIIDKDRRVHMAHIDIHYGFSVNGVAALHTGILEQSELKHFYDIYPEKFNNKTNGITFRRWLLEANHPLADYLVSLIGEGFKKDASELERLLEYRDDSRVKERLLAIKMEKKLALKQYLAETENIEIDENSIFDIQIKRLHEYKRQQMNALYVIHKYLEIKKGRVPSTPVTLIFGAKAAPAYVIAKDIIHLILCLQELIQDDPQVRRHMNLVMVQNYNVTKAEKLIPACDISEQISLASKEASGTSNMKFMLNGAVTLGTMDGANVEIHDLVGDDNIYIFGAGSKEVIEHYAKADYVSKDYYELDPQIKEAVDFITGPELMKIGDPENLNRLQKELIGKDWFMTLLDLKDYIHTKDRMLKDYEDRESWSEKMLVNIAKAGYFSSDRTIAQYNEDIWKLR
ncbi:glycogen/starch/alpha-glucan family phosphorylase [Lachnospiraceae bacterium ASD3451]|uniref:glycogen/starch/alpha-glucan phosphorylase n=1 Tax=Diplocloster agilis TaxID=2850323 RepID=UPI001D400A76|nr:glycogen/starch/alpha-glucan phosphorylase [Diplocloster agilis]MBU9744635.1 glycogen/starch/alpha-glucan family phosphorylase [Diplocloster agilis]